ncbi:hypothetical protein [Ideonella livida]|uniref:Uncharacterized protein n=1 Tax=Ideonella livida TaxID=2707176 RepID=A0A7C9TJG7_9BURK|nr:hypothetical protein [Ideonella livida]NDY92000.1 hypothetical protein [Ideonella livida]
MRLSSALLSQSMALALLVPVSLLAPAADRTFHAEGADTGAGVGPRHIAQGGAGQASSDDVVALYFNPAGLLGLPRWEASVARQTNAQFHRLNFLGVGGPLPAAWTPGWRLALAAGYYPRVHGKAHGAYGEDDFESTFLRYLLPGMSGTFDGDIESKTKEYRLALGLAPEGSAWSFGLYVDRIDCKSHFCGVTARSQGYTVHSSGATAVGVGAGLRWQARPDLVLGVHLSDLDTRLTVRSTITDDAGTRDERNTAQFPRKLSAGLAWQWRGPDRLAADYEVMKGRYGQSAVDMQLLRLGHEWPRGDWAWRAGALVPLRVYSSTGGRMRPAFPISPTAGLGWQTGPWRLDAAVYAHAVMSLHRDGVAPAADVSVSVGF